jgi:hypothetical protein
LVADFHESWLPLVKMCKAPPTKFLKIPSCWREGGGGQEKGGQHNYETLQLRGIKGVFTKKTRY